MATKVQHEFEGDVENGFYKCARCGGPESIHEFGPWDEAEGADLAAIMDRRLFEQERSDEDEDEEKKS